MNKLLFALSLLISFVGNAQITYFKEGDKLRTTDGSVYQIKNGKEVLIARDSSKPIPTIWASQQREIQELTRRMEIRDSSLLYLIDAYDKLDKKYTDLERDYKYLAEINHLNSMSFYGYMERLDSLIKALREKPFNGAWLDGLDTFRTIAPGIILTPSPFPRTFIDSTTQSLISISPDGWTSVSSLPKKKSKRRGKPSTSKPPAKL